MGAEASPGDGETRTRDLLLACPLEALRAGQKDRAWDLVRQRGAAQALNWHLLLAWELSDSGCHEEARAALHDALRRASDVCWQGLLVELVARAARIDAEGAVKLLQFTGATERDTSLVEEVAHDLMVERDAARASEVLKAVADAERRAWAWSRVACLLVDEGRANGGLALASQVDDARALAVLLNACLAKAPSLASHPQFVKAMQRLDDPQVADGVLSLLAVILVGQGNLEGALKACARVTRPGERARALGMVAASAVPLGLVEDADRILDEVSGLLPGVVDAAERGRVLSALCRIAGVKGDIDEARSWFVEACGLLAGLHAGPRLEGAALLAEDAFVAGLEDEVRALLAAQANGSEDARSMRAWEAVGELQRRLGFTSSSSAPVPSCDPVRGRFKRGGAAAGLPALERVAAQGREMGAQGAELLCDLARVALEFGQRDQAESLVASARGVLGCCRPLPDEPVCRDLGMGDAGEEAFPLVQANHIHLAMAEADLGKADEGCQVLQCHLVSGVTRVLGLRKVAGRVLGHGDAHGARGVLAAALREMEG